MVRTVTTNEKVKEVGFVHFDPYKHMIAMNVCFFYIFRLFSIHLKAIKMFFSFESKKRERKKEIS